MIESFIKYLSKLIQYIYQRKALMDFCQQFVIEEQADNQQLLNQYFASAWKKQKMVQYYNHTPTQQFLSFQNFSNDLITQENRTKFQQFYFLPKPHQKQPTIRSKQLIQNFRQKIVGSFTEYIQKCQKLFENIQFAQGGVKRSRKIPQAESDLLFHYISINQILSNQEIKWLESWVEQNEILKQALASSVAWLPSLFVEQAIYLFFKVLNALLIQQRTLKPSISRHSLNPNIQNFCTGIWSDIISENRLKKLTFAQYLQFGTSLPNQNLNKQVEQHFIVLLKSWSETFNDLVKNYLNNCQDDIQDLKQDAFNVSPYRNLVFFINEDESTEQQTEDRQMMTSGLKKINL